MDVVAIECGIIDLGNENELGIGRFHLRQRPFPELHRHHLRHVASESVHAFLSPECEYVSHLLPCVRRRVEVACSASAVVHSVVQFHGLVPVVDRRMRREHVVAGRLGWVLLIALGVELRHETFVRHVVEVVLRVERLRAVVLASEVGGSLWFRVGLVLSRHVVRHEVDDKFQSCLVHSLRHRLKLFHTLIHVHSQVRVYVVVVLYGVWRASLALHHAFVVFGYAVACVVGLCGMLYHAGCPDVRVALFAQVVEYLSAYAVELSASVLLDSAVLYVLSVGVAEQPWQQLIYVYHGYLLCVSLSSMLII